MSTVEPIINWMNNPDGAGDVLQWQTGLDVAQSVNGDLVLAAKYTPGVGTTDFLYVKDFSGAQAFGVGVTPPGSGGVLQISTRDSSSWDVIQARLGASGTGNFFYAYNAANTPMFKIDKDGQVFAIKMKPLTDPGTLSFSPQTAGNSGNSLVSYRGSPSSGVGLDFIPTGNDMSMVLNTASNGLAVVSMRTDTTSVAISPQADHVPLRIFQPSGTPTSYMLSLVNHAGSVDIGGFDMNGTFFTHVNSAPADATVYGNGMLFLWFDPTAGAAKLMFKAKNSAGTLVTGSVPLA